MSLLDDLRARQGKPPELPTFVFKGPRLDANAQDLYDQLQALHPTRTIEVEHWTVMRVYDDNRLCIDVRRSINHE